MKLLKYISEAIIIYLFFFLGKIIGLKFARQLFAFVFIKIGPKFKSVNTINNNLNNISNFNNSEKNVIVSKMWANYGKTFIEYIYLKKFKNNIITTNIRGLHILESIKKKNKPVIFVSGHFANFEIMSMELVKNKINLATIYRPLNNFFLNPFMEYLRKKYVCPNQIKKGAIGIRQVVNFIDKNYSIALMIDQRVSEGENISFFNKNALTTTLPAQLALKYNLDIVPIYISRNIDCFDMKFYNPIEIEPHETKKDISFKLNKVLEKMILKDPSQWILTHNRWK
ncbi:lysophospholipid acyltransferase family protein [Pelagibacteraceae bacterium]|nr:lysophospholipid acyltransferase family protein [Pelagibacteraceae bacterium]